MIKVYKLHNQIKHYKWGSTVILPEFLGLSNDENLPYAEMWMGTHNGAPSQINKNGKQVNLTELSGELPFLLKLLAVEKSLSIQVHPEKEQAFSGFNLEEKNGIPLTAPDRIYKDANQKSEIICALSTFQLMAGFKELSLIIEAFNILSSIAPKISDFISSLKGLLKNNQLLDFLKKLFYIEKSSLDYLCNIILSFDNKENKFDLQQTISHEQWALIKQFASLYPQDPCFLSPLFLNVLTLDPGQAVFIPAGTVHAYIKGFGVELMNNSDNVLRGGLTSKYVNIDEFIKILNLKIYTPQIITPSDENIFSYKTPCDCKLSVLKNDNSQIINKHFNKSAICIVTEGEVSVNGEMFKKSESFFIPSETDQLSLKGCFTLFLAESA